MSESDRTLGFWILIRLIRLNILVFFIVACLGPFLWFSCNYRLVDNYQRDQISISYESIDEKINNSDLSVLSDTIYINPLLNCYSRIKLLDTYVNTDMTSFDSLERVILCSNEFEFNCEPSLRSLFLLTQGRIHCGKYSHTISTQYLRAALSVIDTSGALGKKVLMDILVRLTIEHQYYGGSVDQAEKYAMELRKLNNMYGYDSNAYTNLYCLADLNRQKGNYELAYYWASKAYNFVVQNEFDNYNRLADIEIVRGHIEFNRKNYINARRHFEKGIEAKQTVDPCSSDLLFFYNNYLSLLLNSGDLEEANVIISEFESLNQKHELRWAYMLAKHKGFLHFLKAEYLEALGFYNMAANMSKNLNLNFEDHLDGFELLGSCYLKLGDYDKAIYNYQGALNELPGFEQDSIQTYASYPKALLLEILIAHSKIKKGREHSMKSLINSGLESLSNLEKIAFTLNLYDEPLSSLYGQNEYSFVYDALIDYYLNEPSSSEKIFSLIDRRKSIFMQSKDILKRCNLKGALIDEFEKVNINISNAYQKFYNSNVESKLDLVNLNELIEERKGIIFNVLGNKPHELRSLFDCIMTHSNSNLKPDDVNEDVAFLNYYYNENILAFNRIIITIYLNGKYYVLEKKLSEDDQEFLKYFVRDLPGSLLDKSSNDRIYALFAEDVIEIIKESKRIVVFNDGPLYSFPFENLLNPKTGRRLFEDYIISYAYSISDYLRRPGLKENLDNITAFLFSDIGTIKTGRNKQLSELPGTYIEGECIKTIFKERATIYSGETATQKNIVELRDRIDILHFGLHGDYDPEHLLKNKVWLRSEHSLQADSLFISDLNNLNIQANLLVTTVCYSSAGQKFRSTGTMSFARDFSRFLDSSSLSYLWQANDIEIGEFICMFYNFLNQDKNPVLSLQKAKKQYIAHDPLRIEHISGLVFYH